MKRNLHIHQSFFSFLTLIIFSKRLESSSIYRFKFVLILLLSFFCNSIKAQLRTHPFAASGTLVLPAGIDQVTAEAWGAGGAGGGAQTTLLVGRSGGGGGGGAYAKSILATSTPQTLNVVVGALNLGTGGNGAAGGASFVTGYESSFYAPGGLGGNSNTVDGAVASGGLGGKIAIGSEARANGADGTAGTFTALSLALSSGSGGNAANLGVGAGGTGGAGFVSLILANQNGNNGNNFGGGGGGAISSADLRAGGNGARGNAVLSYTCKTYSLTSIKASNACTSTGTSLVEFTGTAASLPKGNYTVTYSRSSPSGTGTATFSVTTAGIGSFSASGLNIVGNSTITITDLTSVDCSSTISLNNVVTIAVTALPTITLSAISGICTSASAQNVNLPYTATTNIPTNYSITWSPSPANGFLPVTNATLPASPITIAVPAGTAAGNYTGTLIVSNAGCVSTNYTITINVIALPVAPTASATKQPTCIDNTGTITVTSPAAGSGFSYSTDGVTFTNTTGIFTGLATGVYNIRVRSNTTLCVSPTTPITINAVVAKTWNGSAGNNWANAANWTPTGIPSASDCVDIPAIASNPIISGTNAVFFANRLTVENNGFLIVQGTNTLTVTNEVKVLGTGSLILENNSSLVQIADVANTGNVTYRRNSKPIRRYDLTYWSSPVTRVPAFTLNNFSPGTYGDKYFKLDPNNGWIIIYNGAEEMAKGIGYSIRAPQIYDINTPQIYGGEFIGVPNNGTILGPNAVAEKGVLLGNPYPSAIYADQFIHDNATNYYGTLYFWTHNTLPAQTVPGDTHLYYNSDDYAFYNLSGNTTVGTMSGTGATTPGNQAAPLGYIAAGQGFIVQAKTAQKAVFTNSMRVSSNNSQFYKTTAETLERHRVWLNFTNTQGAFKQLLIGYVEGATNLWDDNYDATTLDANPFVDFYSINNNLKLVIQGRALPFDEADTIPLGYRSAIAGDFTIAIDRTDGNLTNQPIYLQDKVTNTLHDLKAADYTFTTAIGVFTERFVLRYKKSGTLETSDFASLDKNVFVSIKDKTIKLQAVSDTENLSETTIYDIGGKLLYNKKDINNKELLITNLQPAHQVLLVKITLDNGHTVTKKIVF